MKRRKNKKDSVIINEVKKRCSLVLTWCFSAHSNVHPLVHISI